MVTSDPVCLGRRGRRTKEACCVAALTLWSLVVMLAAVAMDTVHAALSFLPFIYYRSSRVTWFTLISPDWLLPIERHLAAGERIKRAPPTKYSIIEFLLRMPTSRHMSHLVCREIGDCGEGLV